MPRRTRPTPRTRKPTKPAEEAIHRKSYEAMARNLVERGLATVRILDSRKPMDRSREGRAHG
ncbi:hypothetical protein SAMN05660916_03020 [Arthrobacter sp. 31Cvi3.1E]|nr:hypothetical protein SAMN05660916_03020 [Arthrobacter sp. 31Cvi3.1E]